MSSWRLFSVLSKKKKLYLNGFPQLLIGEIVKMTLTAEGMGWQAILKAGQNRTGTWICLTSLASHFLQARVEGITELLSPDAYSASCMQSLQHYLLARVYKIP